MIHILDEKGKPMGLDHDYEYRGAKRERNRNAPWIKALIMWGTFAVLFGIGGIALIIDGSAGAGIVSLAAAGLFIWIMKNGANRHQRLLEAIGHDKK